MVRTAISKSARAAQFESAPPADQAAQIKKLAGFYRVLGYANPAVILVVYLLDHHSSDATVKRAEAWLGRGLLKIDDVWRDHVLFELVND